MQNQQQQDFELDSNDIKYNFLIGAHGIFEGRGWDVKPEGPPTSINSLSVGFFTEYLYKPGELLNGTLADLMRDGRVIGKLSDDVAFLCQVQLCTVFPQYFWDKFV